MRIGVLRETAPHERRVALVPQSVPKLREAGHAVAIETGAGEAAFFPDAAYATVGAGIGARGEVLAGSEVLLAVQRPPLADLQALPAGTAVIALFQPAGTRDYVAAANSRGLTLLAMELVPRISRAQTMDVLSSQATVAGYQAVLLGASHLARLIPMLTTAAGTIPPGRVFVLGAGVAGLQAIATARRLGAVVSAFDVRAAVQEQVQSLGATFVEAGAVAGAAEDEGGYARELADDQQRKVLEAIGDELPGADLVISTAQIPGKPAPRLITREMVGRMKPGSVIVDLAAESGGNCELTRPGETVVAGGVTILAPSNLPSQIPQHASVMYSRNLQSLLGHLAKDGKLTIQLDDPITGPMCLAHGGTVPSGR
ncbi:MAG TPA: Re/Si-specific NAD(P)(+) transhydrogenase subunit alpha [Gemmatimonadales bacterium]|jgi:NAD(P) transhydrogenase subunit alpha|nr:Re/Si-specific NAD(P)(+) transhydrogenase subunit alpha [Gemmatimonadales bacterium]